MMSKPPPSGPSMAARGTTTPSAVTGLEALPRSPSPLKGAGMRRPAAAAGTSQIVLAPSAASGRLDQT